MAVGHAAAAPAHDLDALLRHDGANQHRARPAIGLRHHVETEVHAVDEIDIRVPGRPVHDRAARGAPMRVRRLIVRAAIRFGLDDQTAQALAIEHAHQPPAEQIAGHVGRRPVEESAG